MLKTHLPVYHFVASCFGNLETIRSLSYIGFENVDTPSTVPRNLTS